MGGMQAMCDQDQIALRDPDVASATALLGGNASDLQRAQQILDVCLADPDAFVRARAAHPGQPRLRGTAVGRGTFAVDLDNVGFLVWLFSLPGKALRVRPEFAACLNAKRFPARA